MAALLNLVGPFVVLGGVLVMLFGRGRAIEVYLGVLTAIGVVILWAGLLSPYSASVAEGLAFGFGLVLIGGTALLMHRVVVPEELEE